MTPLTDRGAMMRPNRMTSELEEVLTRGMGGLGASMSGVGDGTGWMPKDSPPPVVVEPKRQHAPMPAKAMRAMRRGEWTPVQFTHEGEEA